jgi:uncharacterized protein (DUF1330 family)
VHVEPTSEQLQALTTGDLESSVVMLNLLRFRERAEGLDEDVSGREAYQRYGAEVLPHLERVGGEPIWQGRPQVTVIGPSDEFWDAMLLVRYPSVKAFLDMVSDPGYREISKYRTAALLDSRLIAMREV